MDESEPTLIAQTTLPPATGTNPYVGPTPYCENDEHVFEARELEAATLLALAVTERVVVLYSESGAGKTSLVNMKLIPGLRGEGFDVFYVPHIGRPIQRNTDQVLIRNVFCFNTIVHLASVPVTISQTETGNDINDVVSSSDTTPLTKVVDDRESGGTHQKLRKKSQKKSHVKSQTSDMASLSDFLPGFIERHSREGSTLTPGLTYPRGTILIFDQFEELFTEHADRWADREAFFKDVKLASDKLPFLSFVFVIREDSLASLERYAQLVPSRFGARYRIELFTTQQAVAAIRIPAKTAGRPFELAVAEQLAGNLARRQMVENENTYVGEFIEPVYLQVVCYQLWKRLHHRQGATISMDDLKTFGNVDEALQQFYETGVREVSKATGVLEPRIRRWFSLLVTKSGRRTQILREARESGGLANEVINLLEERHLIRTESVGGTKVFLLTHDRLVAPVISVNARLRDKSSNPLLVPSRKWEYDKHNRRHLLRGKSLRNAQRWADADPDQVSKTEAEFLKTSLSVEAEEATRFRIYLGVSVVGCMLAFAAGIWALMSARDASKQAQAVKVQEHVSESKSLALQAVETLTVDPEKSLLLALHAVSKTYPSSNPTPEALAALTEAVHATSRLQLSIDMTDPVKKVAFSPHCHWLATLDTSGRFSIWDAVSGELSFSLPDTGYTAMALSKRDLDQTKTGTEHILFAVGNQNGEVELTNTDTQKPHKYKKCGSVGSVMLSDDGSKLVIGCTDGAIDIEDLQTGQGRIVRLGDSVAPILATRYLSDDNRMLVVANDKLAIMSAEDGPIETVPLSSTAVIFAISDDAKHVVLNSGDQLITKYEE